MQIVTDEVRALVEALEPVTLTLYDSGGDPLAVEINRGTYSPSMGDGASFSFGNACSASLTLEVDGAHPDYEGMEISCKWSVEEPEYVLIQGTVETAEVSAGRTTLTIYDRMYRKGGILFAAPESLKTTAAILSMAEAVAAQMGVSLSASTEALLAGDTVEGGFGNLTGEENCGQIAGYLAGLYGRSAVFNREGELDFRGFTATGDEFETYSGEAKAENLGFKVTGICLAKTEQESVENADGTTSQRETTTEYTAGDGSIRQEMPFCDQAAATRAYEHLSNLDIRPGSYGFPGGILLEPGDIFSVVSMDGTYTVAAMAIRMEYDGGIRTVVECAGLQAEAGQVGSINQAIRGMEAELLRVKRLVAENAVINSANIKTLETEKATIQQLEVTKKLIANVSETITLRVSAAEEAANAASEAAASVSDELQVVKDEVTTLLRIESSRGTVFKNDAVATVLSVVIYRGSQRITDMATLRSVMGQSAYLQWYWQRLDEDSYGIISAEDSRFGADGFTFSLSPEDVDTKITFMCELIA